MVVLPNIYKVVKIAVPQRWSRLASLEDLLGSTGEGLKYTTALMISTQQDLLERLQHYIALVLIWTSALI